ncbi:DsrE family protein [Erythrobacter sp. SCSIO 43205]|uniref:DsrE family protein n=1 Tax=Erythrobacter sp. SCSIO 43205 TaxID=2779361 RepID=UPI001CA93AB2|nr:DsrE family protein [Erythrobacter sp. SCSIO 43205]UAB78158.1 DsrE family protein [Erythrobacter sp. SCSIO 43205]
MRSFIALTALGLAAAPLSAQSPDLSAFKPGPVFAEFGEHAPVEGMNPLPEGASFAIAYDVAQQAEDGILNRRLATPARFYNMHVAAGVPAENISLVVVIHGRAVFDLVTDDAREARDMAPNASDSMVKAMLAEGIRFVICGQSAAAYGVDAKEFIEGVELELSAMTAHALLQQDGYTVNPF